MKKPVLRIEPYFCWGCKTCEVACKQEHRMPSGVKLIAVREEWRQGKDGRAEILFQPNVCRHCDEPACAAACPVEAIRRRDDGIVILDEAECTGCEACVDACPYEAVAFDRIGGVARKCNLCHERVDDGLLPACADNVCLGHCIHFGDADSIHTKIPGIRAEQP